MSMLFILPALAFLGVAMLRRALAFALAAGAAVLIWTTTHDLLATCGGAWLVLCIAAAITDLAAASSSGTVRRIGVGLEGFARALGVAAIIAFALQGHADPAQRALASAIAALFGFGIALNWRNQNALQRRP
ncbi:MAG: hypothetical protein AB7Q23_16920 [Hyphomonadaceae bacterium]|jgi:hypothetical protein|nr:hypothetical protein [Hyphomonadaceae bacterium]